ncbi:MAG: InlB B-repeat-containing protein, partial [Actinomycetota bacterium]|nr:InlB B-repeat-containing protein [Actinomycetota bacterium]
FTIDAPTVLPPPGAVALDAAAEATKLNIGANASSADWGAESGGQVDPVLTVTKTGTGSGTVTSNPAGVNCGTDCSQTYVSGTEVTLTAVAAAGSTFTGWSGACAGTGSCVVTMDAARAVIATFTAATSNHMLTVTVSGSGTVRSTPAGIRCGTDCTESYATGTVVTLTANAGQGTSFTGWSGACTGTGTCTVTMDAAKTVTATFGGGGGGTFLLTVTKSGTGQGNVSSSPTGIKCGSDCTQSYASGTVVTLTAAARSGNTFAGWSGACTGTGSCVVTMNAAKTVTATFNAATGLSSPVAARVW